MTQAAAVADIRARHEEDSGSGLLRGRAWLAHEDRATLLAILANDTRRVMYERRTKFAEVQRLVDDALAQARHQDIQEAINWADLSCHSVEWYEDSAGVSGYRALIEEASPNCSVLCAFVVKHLELNGHNDVEVRTEW